MDQASAENIKQIRDSAKTFARRFVVSAVKNLFTKVLVWGVVFVIAALAYSKFIFSGEKIPQAFSTIGTVGILGIYLAAGIVAGLYFGTLAAVRGMSSDLTRAVGIIVDKGVMAALPADRGTVSVEEIRRIIDRAAPDKGGLSGLPLRLVRKKVMNEVTARSETAGEPSVKVSDIRDYASAKLAGAIMGDIELKANIGRMAGSVLVLLLLAGPPVLMLLL